MIKLTRLGGQEFLLNAELIRYVEECPDTTITLTTGERVIVREKMDEVMRRVIAYQQSKLLFPAHTGHGCRHSCCQHAHRERPAA